MPVEVLNDRIHPPDQNNLTWMFPVRVHDGHEHIRQWLVDSFDLNQWFKEAVGRYPRQERGDKDTLEDLLAHWEQVAPRLQREAEKQAELNTTVGVDGLRTSAADWTAVRNIPREELPPLNGAQRDTARELHVPEEDYARSFLAGERTRKALVAKTERLARLLQREASKYAARVESVILRTFEGRYDLQVRAANGERVPIRLEEAIVDDLFEGGSLDAEHRLERVMQLALDTRVRQ